jgi:3-hydroxyanthranilate 3,4-dioxygenase
MAGPLSALNLDRWIEAHRDELKPPVGARMIWEDSQFIIMVVGGPNARRDFHVDPSDEFFYQLKGDIVLEIIGGDGKRLRQVIREGEVLLLPANTPTPLSARQTRWGWSSNELRGAGEPEGYAWYCERCDAKLYQVSRGEGDLLQDLKRASAEYNASESLRTCKACRYVQPVPTGPRL